MDSTIPPDWEFSLSMWEGLFPRSVLLENLAGNLFWQIDRQNAKLKFASIKSHVQDTVHYINKRMESAKCDVHAGWVNLPTLLTAKFSAYTVHVHTRAYECTPCTPFLLFVAGSDKLLHEYVPSRWDGGGVRWRGWHQSLAVWQRGSSDQWCNWGLAGWKLTLPRFKDKPFHWPIGNSAVTKVPFYF